MCSAKTNLQIVFPAVTVCNQNRVNCDVLKKRLLTCVGDKGTFTEDNCTLSGVNATLHAAQIFMLACNATSKKNTRGTKTLDLKSLLSKAQ